MRDAAFAGTFDQRVKSLGRQPLLVDGRSDRCRHETQRRGDASRLVVVYGLSQRAIVAVGQVARIAVPGEGHAPPTCRNHAVVEEQYVELAEVFGDARQELRACFAMKDELWPASAESITSLTLEVRPVSACHDLHDIPTSERPSPERCGSSRLGGPRTAAQGWTFTRLGKPVSATYKNWNRRSLWTAHGVEARQCSANDHLSQHCREQVEPFPGQPGEHGGPLKG